MKVYSKAGFMGDVDMVVQMKPFVETRDASDNFGKNILALTRWATKTYSDGAQQGCSILYKG
jgi:hypothetical protein